MPELPEVETVARGLQRTVAGCRIVRVTLGKTDFIDNPAEVERELPGRSIERVERYGKFLLLRLGKNAEQQERHERGALFVHLGMTGGLAPTGADAPMTKHTHVVLHLEDGREVRYTDPRRFGRLAFLADAMLDDELKRHGADPLEITAAEFVNLFRGRRARVKAMLLDQSVLRGVGNIYADESLWGAKIHPAKLGERLKPEQAKRLHSALQKILRVAIKLRGSSISNFFGADGLRGEYQLHHQVYGKSGEPCPRCKTKIRRVIVAGRSSHFCPRCQPGPRLKQAQHGRRGRDSR